MRVWRICKARHQALDGEGARLYGGRWNPVGVPMVYASETLSLAALEYLVHFDIEDEPQGLVALGVDLPSEVVILRRPSSELPKNWDHYPAPSALKAIGGQWAKSKASAVLALPSVIIPEEWSYLLNPAHPQLAGLKPAFSRPFRYDRRMPLANGGRPSPR